MWRVLENFEKRELSNRNSKGNFWENKVVEREILY